MTASAAGSCAGNAADGNSAGSCPAQPARPGRAMTTTNVFVDAVVGAASWRSPTTFVNRGQLQAPLLPCDEERPPAGQGSGGDSPAAGTAALASSANPGLSCDAVRRCVRSRVLPLLRNRGLQQGALGIAVGGGVPFYLRADLEHYLRVLAAYMRNHRREKEKMLERAGTYVEAFVGLFFVGCLALLAKELLGMRHIRHDIYRCVARLNSTCLGFLTAVLMVVCLSAAHVSSQSGDDLAGDADLAQDETRLLRVVGCVSGALGTSTLVALLTAVADSVETTVADSVYNNVASRAP